MTVVFIGNKDAANYIALRHYFQNRGIYCLVLNPKTAYWTNLIKRLKKQGLPVIALSTRVSTKLTELSVQHFLAPSVKTVLNEPEILAQNLHKLIAWVNQVAALN